MSDRLQKLQQMLVREPNDLFLLYALAMEQKKLGAHTDALGCLARVLEIDPSYHVAHFQSAQVHELLGDLQSARSAYRAGIEAARRKGDGHAAQEMQAALSAIE